MKHLYLTIALFTFLTTTSSAQELTEAWAKTAGGAGNDQATCVVTDSKGGVYIAGYFDSPTLNLGNTTLTNAGGTDIFVAKYDTAGNFIWAKQYGGTGTETVGRMTIAPDGSLYIAGVFSSDISIGNYNFSGSGSYLAKLDNSGNLVWQKGLMVLILQWQQMRTIIYISRSSSKMVQPAT